MILKQEKEPFPVPFLFLIEGRIPTAPNHLMVSWGRR